MSPLPLRISRRDFGILPLLAALPLMYFPKVLPGDTQPWILAAGLIALFSYRTDRFFERRDLPLLALCAASVIAYAFRTESTFALVRNIYTYMAFATFWVVCGREKGEYFPAAVKLTVVIWFIAGVAQYVSVALGYGVFGGRYVEGYSGVPGLAAEPSFYGSLSMVHLMYLLSLKTGRNGFFIALAAASVVISGSLLAMMLFVFPLMKLPTKFRIAGLVSLPLLVLGDAYIRSAGLIARFGAITQDGLGFASLFLDPSLNLRAGHIYFTLVESLGRTLLFANEISFMSQYNEFAFKTGVLIPTGTDFILTSLGEMLYGGGLFAAVLLLYVFRRAQEHVSSAWTRIERVAFLMACMLNPISLSNIFLIIYARSEVRK